METHRASPVIRTNRQTNRQTDRKTALKTYFFLVEVITTLIWGVLRFMRVTAESKMIQNYLVRRTSLKANSFPQPYLSVLIINTRGGPPGLVCLLLTQLEKDVGG